MSLWDLCAAGAAVCATVSASAAPSTAWQGAQRVVVICNVAGGRGADPAALARELCNQVTSLAASGAPLPVKAVGYGDPELVAADAVTLVVHAAVQDEGGSRRLLVTLRAVRPGLDSTEILFGSTPRAATLPGTGLGGTALQAALDAALDETLPWRAPGPRPIR